METTQPRIMRGYAILAKREQPKPLAENTYLVQSQAGNGNYHVALVDGEWRCECPDFQFRKVVCKHIHAVRFCIFSLEEEVLETSKSIYAKTVERSLFQKMLFKECDMTQD